MLGGLFAVYFVLMFEGLKTARPVSAAAVFTLTPVIAAGFGWLLLRQVTTGRMALALAIGAVGALWVIFLISPFGEIRVSVLYNSVLWVFCCFSGAVGKILGFSGPRFQRIHYVHRSHWRKPSNFGVFPPSAQ